MTNSILQNDLEILRYYMDEKLDLYGIPAQYYQVKPGMTWTVAGEMKANYFDAVRTKVLFDQAPTVSTLRKLGWLTELNGDTQPIVHVSYNLPGLSVGCVFEVKDPLAIDQGRLFRVTKMSVGIIFPAFVTCQLVAVIGSEPTETLTPYDGPQTAFLNPVEQDEEY